MTDQQKEMFVRMWNAVFAATFAQRYAYQDGAGLGTPSERVTDQITRDAQKAADVALASYQRVNVEKVPGPRI